MERYKLLDRLEDIQTANYNRFKGTNEADLATREEIANLFYELVEVLEKQRDKLRAYYELEQERICEFYKLPKGSAVPDLDVVFKDINRIKAQENMDRSELQSEIRVLKLRVNGLLRIINE